TSASPNTQLETRNPQPATVHRSVRGWSWSCWRDIIRLNDALRFDVLNIQYQAAAYGMHPAINLLPLRLRMKTGFRPRTVITFHDLKRPTFFQRPVAYAGG
ncbi:MAG: hypothetical protein ACE5I2_01285, partial [Anaerolineae bacterium]